MATETKEIEIAHQAINMVINNEWKSCEELLMKHKYDLVYSLFHVHSFVCICT